MTQPDPSYIYTPESRLYVLYITMYVQIVHIMKNKIMRFITLCHLLGLLHMTFVALLHLSQMEFAALLCLSRMTFVDLIGLLHIRLFGWPLVKFVAVPKKIYIFGHKLQIRNTCECTARQFL